MTTDATTSQTPAGPDARAVRRVADDYVRACTELDPSLATALGTDPLADGLPRLTPGAADDLAALQRSTLADLDALVEQGLVRADVDAERRCAALLRERLGAALAAHDAGEHLRSLGTLFSPVQAVRTAVVLLPGATAEQVGVAVRRVALVERAYAEYGATLLHGLEQGLPGGPAQVTAVLDQLDAWAAVGQGRGWYAEHLAGLLDRCEEDVPAGLRQQAQEAGQSAQRGVLALRTLLAEQYLPVVQDAPDAVGRERYLVGARRWTGSDIDPLEAYGWGWRDLAAIHARMVEVAGQVLPGSTPKEAMDHLEAHGEAVDGVEEVRQRLQQMMDTAVEELDGRHFDIAEPIRRVEAMIAPPGSAAAPYYSRPSLDLVRPGRTWLPTLGRERFPMWDLVSTWYHEGVPGHHLQLAQWAYLSGELSMFQTSTGSVSAATEGWALYAERLMDELGYLTDPGHLMGYLSAQALRAARVVVDIGMHLGLTVPDDQHGLPVFAPGQRWTPELAGRFLGERTGMTQAFIDSEVVRYLGMPGQAISYKLGERAWLAGREAARARAASEGRELDLRAWHMAALGTGALGLDDLARELAALG
ncbi:DUF885 domain-containing protein [Aquipuribacter hungaricus]|uniref:DUF885 domain-containing protein n=1 Tax=Aquipuribacter hungaricus TaxID=545624 RepID=A0ABV7WEF3_9MICO